MWLKIIVIWETEENMTRFHQRVTIFLGNKHVLEGIQSWHDFRKNYSGFPFSYGIIQPMHYSSQICIRLFWISVLLRNHNFFFLLEPFEISIIIIFNFKHILHWILINLWFPKPLINDMKLDNCESQVWENL